MNKYETLWNEKKSELAKRILEAPNAAVAYGSATELARMELKENKSEAKLSNGEIRMPMKNEVDVMEEIKLLTKPIAELLMTKFDPHTTVIIADGFAKVAFDEFGFPTQEVDE